MAAGTNKKHGLAWMVIGAATFFLFGGSYLGFRMADSYSRKQPFWSIRYDFLNSRKVGIEVLKSGKIEAKLNIEDQHNKSGVMVVDFISNKLSPLPYGNIEFIDVDVFPGKIIVDLADYRITMWPDSVDIENAKGAKGN